MVDMMAQEQHGFYVEFELRAQEDREESIKQGMPVFKDAEFAVITMPGGGLVVDKPITDKLIYEWQHGDNRRKPPSPFAYRAYQAWKDGQEIPVNGTDLKNWPGVTPAQLKTCQAATVRTIEDLADANADTVRKLGMGGVALMQKAKAYLESATSNKASEEVAALGVKMEALQAALEKKDHQIAELMKQLDGVGEPKRGRPKKVA
ncbi:MAG: hypothetical protein O3C57_01290 [Verrucomicrobia bacterium]|nr:hypothetical protein [Verrucomicrobiota bacterium]